MRIMPLDAIHLEHLGAFTSPKHANSLSRQIQICDWEMERQKDSKSALSTLRREKMYYPSPPQRQNHYDNDKFTPQAAKRKRKKKSLAQISLFSGLEMPSDEECDDDYGLERQQH
ncbi:hypothetical protein MKX08_000083 [Trichoderma sp. CBMAI-0020]|nr:hypothetical protein MKX08_000083 [Trichoderma sp. CBMAI-0020]